MARTFFEMLNDRWNAGARVCVGLDPDLKKIPKSFLESKASSSPQYAFNEKVIKATAGLALCYKPNLAFYKGVEGLQALRNTVAAVRNYAEGVPIILDAKYGDIGNTNQGYAETAFDVLKCDAVTVHNYMGMEAMKPFLERKDKGIFVLCRTSNPGADEFQDVTLVATDPPNRSMSMYEYVADRVFNRWNYNGNCALVVGATFPRQLQRVRQIVGDDMQLLLPGIGTQGGDLFEAVMGGINKQKRGIIVNSSSKIMFADDPKAATAELASDTDAILNDIA